MPELRRDPIIGRWIIVDTDHPSQPKDYEYDPQSWKGGTCPFCYGNEAMTPPEIDSIREPNTAPNTSGWLNRVVPNKFPALHIEGNIDRRGVGIYDMSNGIGAHEVLIDSPYHNKDIPELLNEEVERMIIMYCRRSCDLMKDQRFKYIMLFKNFGAAAGASLEHPHSQIIALPMVPKNVMEEIHGADEYFNFRERCIFCDILRQETQEKERIILENKYFLSFFPFVSRFPFELWILPKNHAPHFCFMPKEEIPALAAILKDTIAALRKLFPNMPYNFIIHTSPANGETAAHEGYHWHIEFMPKLMRVAGFEWGSGFYIVPTSPELATKFVKEAQK